MGRKRTPGLIQRNGVWHIEKRIKEAPGGRLRGSTGTSDLQEAERYLARKIEECRNAAIYGIRPHRTFDEAAGKYVIWNQHKASIGHDIRHLRHLMPFLGPLRLEQVHMGTLQPFIEHRKRQGVKLRSINAALATVRHLLQQASGEWIDENGLTWLASPPKIKLFPVTDARQPYPLSWEEQARLFKELPPHIARMALFKVNTGVRDNEVCQLRWDWECQIPELNTSVFIIPAGHVKNRQERLVVLNSVARSVIEGARGMHPERVFVFRGHGIFRMNNYGWREGRKRAGMEHVRVHDLKHTFGRRLRAAGVPLETRKVLLGHTNRDITTHYSTPELAELLEAAERVVERREGPELTILRRVK